MQRVEVLQDVLIQAGEVDKYYGDSVPVNLWRAKNLNKPGLGLFAMVEEEERRAGNVRPPDITIENGWVKVSKAPRGISTFDKPDVFARGKWEYYKIPAGTVLPFGLAIVKDRFNPVLGATHYTIAPAHDMPLEKFKGLLDQLAVQLFAKVS
ncbi:hypothetical protein V8J88_19760 [Massilia sp. W12]|uniref:Tse2 family ADP-ribosyltransferase toxin n=1 Tax=Massilia sp. W12 TaxID=3126507 RepID=UPI0030D42B2A